MRILVSGATGLIGSALTSHLETKGHRIVSLVRSSRGSVYDEVNWDRLAAADLAEMDAVVHLAGENIAGGRWTGARMRRIRSSRVDRTLQLCQLMAQAAESPRVLVCASGAGYYGDRGEEVCTEGSAAGSGFLPETCIAWEAACDPAREAGIRVVHLRLGMVLSTAGGALKKMLPPFRLGLGGRVGNGRQFISWIGMEDVVGVIQAVVDDYRLVGPVNAVAPNPVTNAEFTRTLGATLGRPTIVPAPAAAVRLLLGRMADDLLLASTRVMPQRLIDLGYPFAHPELEPCLRALLQR